MGRAKGQKGRAGTNRARHAVGFRLTDAEQGMVERACTHASVPAGTKARELFMVWVREINGEAGR